MFGIIIGIVSGIVQFFLLSMFTTSVAAGKLSKKTLFFAFTQFLLPFAVLLLSAIFLGETILGENFLMWIGIGMAGALIISAVIRFIIVSKSKNK